MLLLGIFEAGAVVLQFVHILPSNASQFSITGTGINPNIAAMTLCMTLPATIEWTRHKERFNALRLAPLCLIVAAILLTQCRSALLATLLIAEIYMIRYWKAINSKKVRSVLVLASLLLVALFAFTNKQKEASSSGRLTIWKLTGKLIAEKPLSGYGYGYFEKAYNLHQADYFNATIRSEAERMNATYTGMAYNEYMEQTVMGGLAGGVLFAALLLSLIVLGWKQRKTTVAPLTGVLTFALMSLFNFTLAYPVLFLFLLFYAAILTHAEAKANITASTSHSRFFRPVYFGRKTVGIVLLAASAVVLCSLPKYQAQKKLTNADQLLRKGRFTQAGLILKQIEPSIATSEAFYNTKAQYSASMGDFKGAQQALAQVLEHTSNPYAMMDLAQVSANLGNTEKAEQLLVVACGIEPHLFRPRIQLMELYQRAGDTLKAHALANQIIRLKPKIDSPQVQAYKQQARLVLKS